MSTDYAENYQEQEKIPCFICAEKFNAYGPALMAGPLGSKVCAWCKSRTGMFNRFSKLLEGYVALSKTHPAFECECDGHRLLRAILKAAGQ